MADRFANPEHETAFAWAGNLAGRVERMALPDLQAEWTSAAGHRAILKEHSPGILAQLATHVRQRAEALKEAA